MCLNWLLAYRGAELSLVNKTLCVLYVQSVYINVMGCALGAHAGARAVLWVFSSNQ